MLDIIRGLLLSQLIKCSFNRIEGKSIPPQFPPVFWGRKPFPIVFYIKYIFHLEWFFNFLYRLLGVVVLGE